MNYRRVYADGYSYFLTVVTHGRKPLLVDNIELLRYAFRLSKKKYTYRIDAIVILPDHLHMIITPSEAKEYSKIISHIKRSFVYALTVGRGVLSPTHIQIRCTFHLASKSCIARLQRKPTIHAITANVGERTPRPTVLLSTSSTPQPAPKP